MPIRSLLVALGLSLLACSGPLSTREATAHFQANRQGFVAACATFPTQTIRLGQAGRERLATPAGRIFEEPTANELAGAGLSQAEYQQWMTTLDALEVLSMGRTAQAPGVKLDLQYTGISVSGTVISLWCGTQPLYGPPSSVSSGHIEQCEPIEPGWWVCREST